MIVNNKLKTNLNTLTNNIKKKLSFANRPIANLPNNGTNLQGIAAMSKWNNSR